MADIELVIKISKELYDLVQNKLDFNGDLDKQKVKALMLAIDNGTPLPKGHGRIGDLDALEAELSNGIKAGLMIEGYENYSNINNVDDCLECVKYADTIIEADRSEEI